MAQVYTIVYDIVKVKLYIKGEKRLPVRHRFLKIEGCSKRKGKRKIITELKAKDGRWIPTCSPAAALAEHFDHLRQSTQPVFPVLLQTSLDAVRIPFGDGLNDLLMLSNR